jgi:hypothetical protein
MLREWVKLEGGILVGHRHILREDVVLGVVRERSIKHTRYLALFTS